MKIFLQIFMCWIAACLAITENFIDTTLIPPQIRVEHTISFVSANQKEQKLIVNQTSQINSKSLKHQEESINNHYDVDSDFKNMNLLATKERPELNPVLSALINEDVMKSIEAKRAIEQAELQMVNMQTVSNENKQEILDNKKHKLFDFTTAIPISVLTSEPILKDAKLENDDNLGSIGFVDQSINLDEAGSENSKKSRIEIKKGPNGQDYEYEYVYYYEDDVNDNEDDEDKSVQKTVDGEIQLESRGKSRYTNLDPSTTTSPTDNSLVSGRPKGRSSHLGETIVKETIETDRLPTVTRFPSRGKSATTSPTPTLDTVENAAEKKRINIKHPSLELVDSETFNTDEKQIKGTRNGDTEAKTAITIEQEIDTTRALTATAEQAGNVKKSEQTKDVKINKVIKTDNEHEKILDELITEQSTLPMEKAALDLYAILANENSNMADTTITNLDFNSATDVTTFFTDTTSIYDEDPLTTTVTDDENTLLSITTTMQPTTTTTTTTTQTPITTTVKTIGSQSLFGGKRPHLNGRHRYKPKSGSFTASTTTETTTSAEPQKNGRNRFTRPSIGNRNRLTNKTTIQPAISTSEDEIIAKEAKPIASGFSRNKSRNRFSHRGSLSTTETSISSADSEIDLVTSTTARTLRARPNLNLRGRNRVTTTKTPSVEGNETANDNENSVDDKPVTRVNIPGKASRFNINRSSSHRLPLRSKFSKSTTEANVHEDIATVVPNNIKTELDENDRLGTSNSEATESNSAPVYGLDRLKNRIRPVSTTKTDKLKLNSPIHVQRKVNPLLAKRRLQIAPSTTEAVILDETAANTSSIEEIEKGEKAEASNSEPKFELVDEIDVMKKTQPRGLTLLSQKKRSFLRKPGTLL